MGRSKRGILGRIRNNEEMNRSINGEDIMKSIEAQSIRWLGHVKRREVGAMPKKVMEGRLLTGRRRGRHCLRWMDNVVADLKVMKIKQRMEKTKETDSNGNWLLRRTRLTQGCSADRKEDKLRWL
jgi:hypothetical protein